MGTLSEVAPSFEGVDKSLFRREMTALRLEMFALAWLHRFNAEKSFEQSSCTRRYLEEIGNLDIWEIMHEYTHVVSESVTLNAKGEKLPAEVVTMDDKTLHNMLLDWTKQNPDFEGQPEATEKQIICVGLVIYRTGADIRREDCLLVALLSAKLVERFGLNWNFKLGAFQPEAFYEVI
jgi:hypothetical protein